MPILLWEPANVLVNQLLGILSLSGTLSCRALIVCHIAQPGGSRSLAALSVLSVPLLRRFDTVLCAVQHRPVLSHDACATAHLPATTPELAAAFSTPAPSCGLQASFPPPPLSAVYKILPGRKWELIKKDCSRGNSSWCGEVMHANATCRNGGDEEEILAMSGFGGAPIRTAGACLDLMLALTAAPENCSGVFVHSYTPAQGSEPHGWFCSCIKAGKTCNVVQFANSNVYRVPGWMDPIAAKGT